MSKHPDTDLEHLVEQLLALDECDRETDEREEERRATSNRLVWLDDRLAQLRQDHDEIARNVGAMLLEIADLLALGSEVRLVDASGDTVAEWDARWLLDRVRDQLRRAEGGE